MEETTNPSAEVVGVDERTTMNQLSGFLDRTTKDARPEQPDRPAPEVKPATDDSQAATGELTPDDIPDETTPVTAQPSDDAFEIVYDGQQKKLSRQETIELAQKGFDYTQKTQQLAEVQRQVQERLQRVQAIEQVHPQLQQAQAQVYALQAQLQPYQNVDWVALATNDPLEYSKVRAQYDVLAQTHQRAYGQYQQISGAIQQQTAALSAQALQVEGQKLTERIPAWKDPEKYKAGAAELSSWLISEGADPAEVASLNSSVAVSIAWKAMQYDKLVKAKSGKVKLLQTAPPVTRPGAVETGSAGADRTAQLKAKFAKSGDIRDGAALLSRMMK